jgi:hypothetical protein
MSNIGEKKEFKGRKLKNPNKTPKKPKKKQKNQKKTIKPPKTQKKPTGLGFFYKKPGFLPTLVLTEHTIVEL